MITRSANQNTSINPQIQRIRSERNTKIRSNYRATVARMVEPTPRAVATIPSPQVEDAIGLVGSLRVGLVATQAELPNGLCI